MKVADLFDKGKGLSQMFRMKRPQKNTEAYKNRSLNLCYKLQIISGVNSICYFKRLNGQPNSISLM